MQTDSTNIPPLTPATGWLGYFVTDDGDIYSDHYGDLRKLKPWLGTTGYWWVALRRDGKTTNIRVHTLMLITFVGPCPKGMECCHEDGNRLNNKKGNLRWDTRANNIADRARHGTNPCGEKNGSARLTTKQIEEIIAAYAVTENRPSQYKLASIYGISQGAISNIVRGKRWKHLRQRAESISIVP